MYNTFATPPWAIFTSARFKKCVVYNILPKPYGSRFWAERALQKPIVIGLHEREREPWIPGLRTCSAPHTGAKIRSCEIALDAHVKTHLHRGSREVRDCDAPLREHQERDADRCPPIGRSCSPSTKRATVCSSTSTAASSCTGFPLRTTSGLSNSTSTGPRPGEDSTRRRARRGFDLYLHPLSTFYSININMLNSYWYPLHPIKLTY